ncbi:MAG: HEAT repeat domain-containing protein [Anaerolineae bacterium]|nr:HEAT repeat domain-containing protein [Anaerolineae bacterium]
MIDTTIQQLSSTDAGKRREAIIALGRAGDPRALPALLNIYKTDPDPALRELALKAGRHIKQVQSAAAPAAAKVPAAPKSASAPAVRQVAPPRDLLDEEPVFEALPAAAYTPPPPIAPPFVEDKPAEPPPEKPRKIASENEKRLAQGKLDSAIGFRMQGNTEKALAELTAAVRADPDIAQQAVAINLAAELTGIKPPTDAIESIIQQAEAVPVRRNMQNLVAASSGALSDPAMIGLVLDVLILTVITLLMMLVVAAGVSNYVDERMTTQPSTSMMPLTNPFRGATVIAIIVGLGVASIFFTLSSLFRNGITYIVGTFMGGAGELFKFLSATTRFQSIITVPITIAFALAFVAPSIPALKGGAEPLAVIGLIILVLTGLISLIGYIIVVARAHEVGFFKGLVIIFVGSMAQNCVLYLLSNVLVAPAFTPR